ncbi:MAG: DNA-directed RNA polymerase subunit alpha [Magnetococcus sp. YQC-3]
MECTGTGQNLIKPQRVEFVEVGDSRCRATVTVEPLERGFGTTLGNALRRVLISSLQGAAISSVRIGGALDAISAIPGIVENATDILLNLKGVIVRMESGGTQTMSLVSEREGLATAGDIMPVPGIEILNPDYPISTISKGGRLDMLMTVTTGRGYVPAGPVADDGGIPIDCSYSPVKYASYQVSNARIGQQTDYDRLVFDVETNGILSPEDAMDAAARILWEQLAVFINFDAAAFVEKQQVDTTLKWNPALFYRVADLELTVRSANVLSKLDLLYVGDLVQKDAKDLLKLPNFGKKSIDEIKELLAGMELELGMQLDGWPPEDFEAISKQVEL